MPKSVHTRQYKLLLGTLIKARKSRALTQTQVAKRLGRPQSFVAKYENGERRLDVVELIAVAKILGIDPAKVVARLAESP